MRPFAEIYPRSVRDPGSADALGALAAKCHGILSGPWAPRYYTRSKEIAFR
jgi:hypothetical protein